MDYIIYSVSGGGWVTSNGTLRSEWKRAQAYSFDTALELARGHTTHDGEPGWIVVPVAVMKELTQ